MYKRQRKNFTLIHLILILVTISIVCLSVGYYGSGTTLQVTVTEKERITTGSGDSLSSKYLVFTESEVFENTDNLFLLKFNSSDIYRKLEIDETYTVKVYGWRVPFLSLYRNIISTQD